MFADPEFSTKWTDRGIAVLAGRMYMPVWLKDFSPILILLAVVAVIFWRLPAVDVGHDKKYLRRRIMNWLPLGLTYAFLYMGRYNLKISKFAFEEMWGFYVCWTGF
jgi:hypothetical protein